MRLFLVICLLGMQAQAAVPVGWKWVVGQVKRSTEPGGGDYNGVTLWVSANKVELSYLGSMGMIKISESELAAKLHGVLKSRAEKQVVVVVGRRVSLNRLFSVLAVCSTEVDRFLFPK